MRFQLVLLDANEQGVICANAYQHQTLRQLFQSLWIFRSVTRWKTSFSVDLGDIKKKEPNAQLLHTKTWNGTLHENIIENFWVYVRKCTRIQHGKMLNMAKVACQRVSSQTHLYPHPKKRQLCLWKSTSCTICSKLFIEYSLFTDVESVYTWNVFIVQSKSFENTHTLDSLLNLFGIFWETSHLVRYLFQ